MLEVLRALRLGAVNLFGIAVPGFLILFFPGFGFLVPTVTIALDISGRSWADILTIYEANKFVVLLVVVILSYVAGYILRLASPDELDKVSARNVLKTMSEKERLVWPYTGLEEDKFPYLNFWKYLEARNLTDCLEHVTWGPGEDVNLPAGFEKRKDSTKRSKTAVNVMKLDILLHCPELAAVVESNEAHVRLMSGAWLAIKTSWLWVAGGTLLCLAATLVTQVLGFAQLPGNWGEGMFSSASRYYPAYTVFCLSLLTALLWARWKIQWMFHYRRVSELVYIVQSAHLSRECGKKDTRHGNPGT